MRKKGIIFILIVLGLFTGCSMEKGKGVGDIAPDFTLKSIDGHDISLSEYRGKVVLIDFWATWCPPCEDSVPALNNIYKKHKDNGFIILGLSLDNKPSVVKTFKGRYKIDYPLLMAGKATAKLYGVSGIPSMFILDRDGKIADRIDGVSRSLETELEGKIKELL